MKKLLLLVSILLVLTVVIPSTVLAATGRQTWQLNSDYVMAKYPGPNSGKPATSVLLASGHSAMWLADQVSEGVTFPSNGGWLIDLYTSQWTSSYNCTAVVGRWDGFNFSPISSTIYPVSIAGSLGTWIIRYDFLLSDFTVPSGQYLALQITNGDTIAHNIYTGAGRSAISSPQTDPGYPTPEVASIVLLGLGMAGLGTFVVIQRKKAVSKV